MHFPWSNLLEAGIAAAGLWIGSTLAKSHANSATFQRAVVLEKIAAAAASIVVALYPTAPWALLLEQVVARVSAAAGLPTKNADAIERAAAHALTGLGKNPGTR